MYNPIQAQETGTWSALKYKHYRRHVSGVGENIKITAWTYRVSTVEMEEHRYASEWKQHTEAEEHPSCEVVLNTSVLYRDKMPDCEG